MAVARELADRAQHRQRVDAGMAVEAAVLIGLEQGEIARRDVANLGPDAPIAVGGEIGAQQGAVARDDFGRKRARPRHVRRIGDVRRRDRADEAEEGEEDGDETPPSSSPACGGGAERSEAEGGPLPRARLPRAPPPPQTGEDAHLIVTLPIAVRAMTPGAYMSSTTPAGITKAPVVTARAT